jgi:branched-chain amino acid transport system substrate-binding protein
MQHGAEPNSAVVKEILAKVHDKGQGTGPKRRSRPGAVHARPDGAMLAVEGVRAPRSASARARS